jgi:uroporphyrinogen-III decarboxylase
LEPENEFGITRISRIPALTTLILPVSSFYLRKNRTGRKREIGMHPLERDAGVDIALVKKTYGGRICIFGNVNNKRTMVTGSVEDVEPEVKECVGIAAPGGGYCLSTDHGVHDDVPNKNVFALYEAGRK